MGNKYENYKNEINQGKKTRNQVRKEVGLPPIKGGDTKLFNMENAFCRKIQERR
ncbi:hypothetical protein [Clostridium perfringens]|uniref:hypothetical protein n=1 Tax=Clostridium perfringens TaxID=1502 RepID=UPI002342108E|nr:hypothetical protein [Clostridium perfringens]MDC4245318.1 hypothetical protein [Clostridium perfringens]